MKFLYNKRTCILADRPSLQHRHQLGSVILNFMIRSHNRKKSGSGSAFNEILHPDLHSAEGLETDLQKINADPINYYWKFFELDDIHILTSDKSATVL
jgi:hypothetical protein